jgi:hypothetical protein
MSMVLMLAAACSSTPTTTDNAAGLKADAVRYTRASFSGDAKTLLSYWPGKCRGGISPQFIAKALSGARVRGIHVRGSAGLVVTVSVRNVHDVHGEAKMSVAASGGYPAGTTAWTPFVFTRGQWRLVGNSGPPQQGLNTCTPTFSSGEVTGRPQG